MDQANTATNKSGYSAPAREKAPPQAQQVVLGRVGAPSADQIEFFATDANLGIGAGGNLLNTMVETRVR